MPTMPTGPLAREVPFSREAAMSAAVAVDAALAGDVALGLDPLLADLPAHLGLLGDLIALEADALLGHRALLDDRLLGVERDLVLLLGDVAAGQRGVAVGVRDRLALDPDLLAGDGDGLGDVLGDDVLAQPGPADLLGAGADVEPLLRAGHGVVGRRAGGVVADGAGRAGHRVGLRAGVHAALHAGVHAVVAVELQLLLRGEVPVGVDLRGVLHAVLGH